MPSFSDLPIELTTDILAAAIPQHPNPSCILVVNRYFNDIGQSIIYTSLRFKNEYQLVRFALRRSFDDTHYAGSSDTAAKKLLPHSPRSMSVRIPGGQGTGVIFEGIKHVFELCAEAAGANVFALDSLEFCLHSHTSDPGPWKIFEALSLVKYVPSLVCGTCKLTRRFGDLLRQST